MKLYVESQLNPIAIGVSRPFFSWEVPLAGRNRRQTAYQILVATGVERLAPGQADLWDSGKVESEQSTHIEYAGGELSSNQDYVWAVQVWDESAQPCGFSSGGTFGTALLQESDWKAKWIGMGASKEPAFDPYCIKQDDASGGLQLVDSDMEKLPGGFRSFTPEVRSPILRTSFTLAKMVKRARVFVSGLGLFELRLNGKKVGNDVLSTPRTEFRKRVYYSTYDVTDLLRCGDNAVGILLGNGWFNGQKKFWHWQAPWYGSPRALVQLEIAYDDGSSEQVVSDGSWRGDWSPITLNCLYDGEDYDARLEQDGWDEASFVDASWSPVNVVSSPGGRLVAMDHEPNRVMKRVSPVSLREVEAGVYVFDMGTVMTGWAKLLIRNAIAGGTVKLRFGELQHEDGRLDPRTGAGARQADCYVMKGKPEECYEPRFTYHGFRYVELTGYPGVPELDTLAGCFVHNGVGASGTFECGHGLINKIHRCTLQSQRCNMQMGVPTDDTQREERLGWCGDAWSYAEECFYNLDASRFWKKWIADFYDQQDENGLVGYITPLAGFGEDLVWSSAFLLIPWRHYIHYGDRRILESSYPFMQKYIAYLGKVGEKRLPALPAEEVANVLFPEPGWQARFHGGENRGHLQRSRFGDHLATNEGASGMGKDQPRSMATAFYHLDVLTMARIAETLGKAREAEEYRTLAAQIKEAYNLEFYDKASGFYDVGCQSAQAIALCFDLVPESERGRVQGYLNSSVNYRQRCITSGYAGTKWVVEAIAHSGRNDILWTRATATDYPSWGHMLKENKTTITENWHGAASQCHTTLGAAIDEWFYWGLAGIRPDATGPGYENVVVRPYLPKDLPWARATVSTVRGTIVSNWKQEGGTATLQVTIPPNSTGTVWLPTGNPKAVLEGDAPLLKVDDVLHVACRENETAVKVGSGTYCFSWPLQ